MLYVPSAALPRNLAKAAVALVVVLGSRDVEMPATQPRITHGPTAWRPANVSSGLRSCICIHTRAKWIISCLAAHCHVVVSSLACEPLIGENPIIARTNAPPPPSCPKCGTFKKTGRVSCCAPRGAWDGDCGDPGDLTFGHTWFEGVKACAGKPRA